MFGKSKKHYTATVVKTFTDLYVGMAGDEHQRVVNKGEEGKAESSGNGKYKITMKDVLDTPYDRPMVLHISEKDPEFKCFEFKETEGPIKKSSLFG